MKVFTKITFSSMIIVSSISAMTMEVDNSKDVSYDMEKNTATTKWYKEKRDRSGKSKKIEYRSTKKVKSLPIPTISIPSIKQKKKRDRNHTKSTSTMTIIPLMGSVPRVGKLLFTNGGNPKVCTASLLDNSRILLTAAHCLYYHGKASKNIKFFPQSGGEVVGGHISIPDTWAKKNLSDMQRYRYDYGFVVLEKSPNITPYSLSDGQIPSSSQVIAYGYQNGGRYLRQAESIYNYNSTLKMLRMKSALLEGASGGPWVGSGSHTMGINSFYIKEQPGKMYSPYLGDNFKKLYKEASGKVSGGSTKSSSICPF